MKITEKQNRHEQRRGVSTVELIAACALLMTVAAVIGPFLSRIGTMNQEISDREFAMRELYNLVVELQHNVNQDIEPTPQMKARLEQPELTVSQPAEDVEQLTMLSLRWMNRHGQQTSPISLSFWRETRNEEGEP